MPDAESSPVAFPSTLWAEVENAQPGRTSRQDALTRLFERYWKPVYWYLRLSRNQDAPTAMDLTQSFFLHLLESDLVARANPGRGKFRSYLKTSLKNFVIDAARIDQAVRRGGTALKISLDDLERGAGVNIAAGRDHGPENVFEREWISAVVARAVDSVRARYQSTDRALYFDIFKAHDLDGQGQVSYTDLAARFHVSEHDVRNYLRATRESFRDAVRAEVRDTVGSSVELGEELAELFGGLK